MKAGGLDDTSQGNNKKIYIKSKTDGEERGRGKEERNRAG
jgi:hypothetical protein